MVLEGEVWTFDIIEHEFPRCDKREAISWMPSQNFCKDDANITAAENKIKLSSSCGFECEVLKKIAIYVIDEEKPEEGSKKDSDVLVEYYNYNWNENSKSS